jgi:hypothetical protein
MFRLLGKRLGTDKDSALETVGRFEF